MLRTRNRPLASGRLTARAALTFAIGIEVAAFAFLWATVNLLSAALAVAACLFYVFVYTLWLKRTSTQNIVIGGAPGRGPRPTRGTARRGRRRGARAHRLDGRSRPARLGPARAVRRGVRVDAPALLGAGHPLPRR